ncbi:MAG TPA: outer membrane beta-barrel protein, partial [Caulobacteraceae bacterium]
MSLRTVWLLSTFAGFALAAASARAEEPSPAPSKGAVSGWLSSVVIDGRIEIGATLNPANPDTGINFGQLFTDKADQVVLNQFDLKAERAVDANGGRFDFGFAVEGFYGLDSQFTHFMGIGDQGSSGRNSFDLVQANVVAFAPVARSVGVEAKAGLFVTPMGHERLDPRQNFFYSNSYIFNFGLPRKHTGVLTTTHLGADVDVYLGYDTGANASVGAGGGFDDARPHALAGLVVRLGQVSIQGFTHIGPEDTPAVLPAGVDPHRQLRFYNDLVVDWTVSPRLNAAAEFNYLEDEGLHARAGGAAGYLTYDLSPHLSAGVRAEVWRDAEGAFAAAYPGNLDYLDAEEGLPNHAFHPGPATYGEVTVGLNFRPALSLDLADSPFGQTTIRPEIRYDRVLTGDSGFGGRPGSARDQVTFAVDVVVPLEFPHSANAGARHFIDNLPSESLKGEPEERPIEASSEAIATAPASLAPLDAGPGPYLALGPAEVLLTSPRTVQDLDGYAANVTLARSADGPALAPYIRGLGDDAVHAGQVPAVGLVLDGVEIDGALAQMLDPWDLIAMRVDYGPSGLDQGQDADAGVIALETAAPTRTWGLSAQYGVEQGFHTSDARVRLNAPLGDTAGLEVSLSHLQRGGFDNNIYLGDALYGREETTLGAARLAWSVTPALDVDLAVTAGHLDGQGSPFALGDTLDGQTPLGPYQTGADQPNGESLSAQVYSLTVRDRSPLGEVASITAFVHERQDTAQDLDGGCA